MMVIFASISSEAMRYSVVVTDHTTAGETKSTAIGEPVHVPREDLVKALHVKCRRDNIARSNLRHPSAVAVGHMNLGCTAGTAK